MDIDQKSHISKNGLIIFVKNPEPGKVKTRLAKDIGDQAALNVYLRLLEITRKVSLGVDCKRYLFYHESVIKDDPWSPLQFSKFVQVSGDLGSRMLNGFERVLEENDKAIIIGSDCPDIQSDIIETAFIKLNDHDVVIGPTLDGGYYLLGMKALHPYLFNDMSWSTPSVFEESIRRLSSNGVSHALMPMMSDLDNFEDLKRSGLNWND